MKTFLRSVLVSALLLLVMSVRLVQGATTIISDGFNVTGSGSGFALNKGVNTGINPPTTRLTGSTVSGLRYINTATKATNSYTITSNKLKVAAAANAGRFTLSSDGTTAFNFGPALGVSAATPANPVVYDISISMDNDSTGTQRFSFALGTAEGDATTWNFGFQVYRAATGNNYYTIGKRIDTASCGLASDLNAAVYNMAASTYGTEITILMRVTDAGAETTTFNSRVQLSINGGSSWFYDTETDPDLAATGFRLDAATRCFMWDVAPDAGPVTYDNFTVTWQSGPRTWTGGGASGNWSTSANWGGATPSSGDKLIFNGTTRQTSTNDISGLVVPWIKFNNGGFTLYGNTLTNSGAITNASGNNTFAQALAWSSAGAKTWSIASGSELQLNATTTIEVAGDHSVLGGGTLRSRGIINIGQATTASPAFTVKEGKHIVDAASFNSRGDYRIGSLGSAETILTNGATLALTASAATLRVGDSANSVTSRLTLNNSTVTLAGGNLSLPYAAGATGEVTQVGGTVSGAVLNFSQAGAGAGTYTVSGGTLQPLQIKKTTSTGVAQINFDGATLTPASGASNAIMSGLNVAQIQAGGLTVDASADIVIGQALSGSGALAKTGNNKLTLGGVNTYSGSTFINLGTLALGTGASIANSPIISITSGTTFDVSAVSGYAVNGAQTLVRPSSSGIGNIVGSVSLNSGAAISLQADGGSGSVGTLSIAGGINVNANTISVNVSGSPLGVGTYALISYTGAKTGSFNATPVITGAGLALGTAAQIIENAGQIALQVFETPHIWTGGGANGNWSTGANWNGVAPSSGDEITFNGTTRLANTNDISGLTVPSIVFKNGNFTLYGNTVTNSGAITNQAGNNTFVQGLAWSSTAPKTWSIGSGSEIKLNNATSVEVNGDHTVVGGGTLRVSGQMDIGQSTTANPAFVINEGKVVVDGGNFTSRGGYRIGSLATGTGAQTILTNGASFTLTVSGGNLRVGDSANAVASQLTINNSTLSMAGGNLGIAYAAGATGTVTQNGGTVSGCEVAFSDAGAGTGSYTISGGGVLEALQIREDNAGTSSIYFDNATLRTASGANSNFMSGLDTAQIQAGGLTVDATTAVDIAQVLSGTGALTKTGASALTVSGANTYSGNTIINAGTLALGVGGSVASPTISIASGATYDVSAISGYAVGGTKTLACSSTSGTANVDGSVIFSSGAKASFQVNGTGKTVGALSIAGGLTLNGNTITVNVTGTALSAGSYTLINYTGSKSGSFNATPTITGSGLGAGLVAEIEETAGLVKLNVYTPGTPAHGIAAANIKVIQNDMANNIYAVDVSTTTSINGFQIRDDSNRGDYNVQVGTDSTDDVNTGVLIASVSQNGRDNGEPSGVNYCTASFSYSRSGTEAGSYFVAVANSPDGAEYNINVSAAFFPYAKWLGGYARNSGNTNGGANNLFTGSAGLVLGTHFIDNGDGTSTVDLSSLGINSQTDGVLLVTHGGNEDNYASSKAQSNGTWTVYVKDNGTNGAVFEQDPVGFVFIPKSNTSVISGKFQGDGAILMYNGDTPRFDVTNVATGEWQLTIPGYSPNSGVLIVSAEGGDAANQDNVVSFAASGTGWRIQSRDLPGMGLQTPGTAVASFVFIPAPGAGLVSPANKATGVATPPTLRVTVTNATGGNLKVTYYGRQAPKPYPGRDFAIAVLPDTQNYAREESGYGQAIRDMWYAQTDWIAENRVSRNIAYVAHLGDIVNNGDILNGSPNNTQWRIATNAMYRLENPNTTLLMEGIPYGMAVGNHDQEPIDDPDGTTDLFNQYFGISHFSDKSYYGGHYASNNDNHYSLFSASGLDFIVIYIENERYGSQVLDWADNLLATHMNRRAIVVTHNSGSDTTPVTRSVQSQAIFDALKGRTNFFLMLGGHKFENGGEGSRSDSYAGRTIRTYIADYQNRMNGGNGWMRMMYFSPSNNTVSIETYSPWLNQYERDADSEMSFTYGMQLPTGAGSSGTPYVALGTNTVAAGSQSSFVWSGLQANKTYRWYVTVTDEAGDTATSSEWEFTTAVSGAPPVTDGTEVWKSTYGITDLNADTDGDGQSNMAEYIAGTNPTNAMSRLHISYAGAKTNGQFTLQWSSMGGLRYRIQYADGTPENFKDLVRDAIDETDPNPRGKSSMRWYTDTLAPTNTVRYYRIKVVPSN